jgi:6-phosphogluconolactonase
MPHEALDIAENAQAAANACAAWIIQELRNVLAGQSVARIAISGGSSPKPMFDTFAKTRFDWSRVHIFWVDERCVPPSDSQSNYKMANEEWFIPAAVPIENIHRIKGELAPSEGTSQYLEEIRKWFGLSEGNLPVFDVIHRGMGADAHTASLFPGEPLIGNRTDIAAPVYVQKLDMHRVTLLPGVLLAAKKTVLLATGEDKAEPLFQVLRGLEDPFRFPCQIATRGSFNALWFIDRAAASRL